MLKKKFFVKMFTMMLLQMYQIFSSLRGHLHFSVHFFFTFTVYFFFNHPISRKNMMIFRRQILHKLYHPTHRPSIHDFQSFPPFIPLSQTLAVIVTFIVNSLGVFHRCFQPLSTPPLPQ